MGLLFFLRMNLINHLKPSVLYGSRDRRRLFIYAGLTYMLLALTDGVPF